MIYKLKYLGPTAADIIGLKVVKKLGMLTDNDFVIKGNKGVLVNPSRYFSGLRDNWDRSITFCHRKGKESIEDAVKRLENAQHSVFLLPMEFEPYINAQTIHYAPLYVFLKNQSPMVVFGRMMANSAVEVYPEFKRPQDFPQSCYVGPNVYVADNVKIGENVKLIGNIYIYSDVKIGNNVIVKPGAVIGGEGFEKEYDPTFDCTWHWPHMGGVSIEDNVQIGSNTCIDRGMFSDTIIRRGAQIDNLVHVAHSVEIGENARVVASTMFGGSTKIGERSWIATSIIKNGITLGDDCFIGLGSVVVKDIPKGKLAYGVPAKIKE